VAKGRVIVVGAGPAGVRAAQVLAGAGLRPVVIDEGHAAGGQIYRRQPGNFTRPPKALYGDDAAKAVDLHASFDALGDGVDYRPHTLAWALREDQLYIESEGALEALRFDAIVLATGATDRLAPVKGWTLPGCYSLGGAQIALKAQACSIGARPVFMGTGPLLYLVAYQYAKAGAKPAAVLDTSGFGAQVKALPDLWARAGLLWRGMVYRARLMAAGVAIYHGVTPVEITGPDEVSGVAFRDGRGRMRHVAGDGVAMGYHLRSETQLADLAGCPFVFDEALGQWRPEVDGDGRSGRAGVYLAGDGARVLGADGAEIAGRLAAMAVLADLGLPVDEAEREDLRGKMAVMERFRRGLATAFPWPAHLAREVADEVIVCRCEAITAGEIRQTALAKGAPEMNRAKALSRIGMGRCQGRYCGQAAAEILAQARGCSLQEVGRLRGAAPVKPLNMGAKP
jgi:NADPH-dependent 2,4-dienoyl-CoA reductase/sulfur reductase-like enzyme